MTAADLVRFDLVPLLTAILAAVACALPGNILLLRREALTADAVSHAVLPGLVAAFAISGSAATAPLVAGALAAAFAALTLIRFLHGRLGVERSAATGVVFTAFFALGFVLIERLGVRNTNFDIHTALFGNLETNAWLAASGPGSLLDPVALAEVPGVLPRAALAAAVAAAVLVASFKELRLVAFDETFGRAVGAPVGLAIALLYAVTALVCVLALEAVGVIIVVAMFVCPAAAARCLTDDLRRQVGLSAAFAAAAAVLGYLGAVALPAALGLSRSLSAAGSMAVAAGLIQAAAMAVDARRRTASAPLPHGTRVSC
jgi:manganese/zinc/iron transport system permease protein